MEHDVTFTLRDIFFVLFRSLKIYVGFYVLRTLRNRATVVMLYGYSSGQLETETNAYT